MALQPDVPTTPSVDEVPRDLNAWLKAAIIIHSIQALASAKHGGTQQAFEKHLLDLISEALPAGRGAVLLEETINGFGSKSDSERVPTGDLSSPLLRDIAGRVLDKRTAVMLNDVAEDGRDRSVIAVPIVASEKVFGVICLESESPAARFNESHLQLLTAVAGIAAVALANASQIKQLESENQRLQEELDIRHDIVGESSRMRDVYRFISRVAPADSTVLIRGESGTGKELVARAMHRNSRREGKAFVAINCAALTETLLESELFGHEKGAFTGALTQKKGKLEAADSGTVFLDEIGEASAAIQAKLLRVLQEREFERVGGTRPIRVDIRMIAATNRDLAESIRTGSFRQDLYYRLNVISITMPPLRERRDDIPLLAQHFVAKYSEKCKRRVHGISRQALACLMDYTWPGNVRELENAIEHAVVLGSTDEIVPEDLPETLLETEPSRHDPIAKYHEGVFEAKKQLIVNAIEQAHGNLAEAARRLGLNPTYLHRLIRNMNL